MEWKGKKEDNQQIVKFHQDLVHSDLPLPMKHKFMQSGKEWHSLFELYRWLPTVTDGYVLMVSAKELFSLACSVYRNSWQNNTKKI